MTAVSILVPTYNRAAYLKDCLDSLLATTAPCEIIVADNASTDATAAVLATYSDPRLRYLRQETNQGAFANYNFLLQAASQDYLCLFGDDDIALPGCFEKKLALLDSHPEVAGVYSVAHVMDADGTVSVGSSVRGVPEFPHLAGRDDFTHLLVNCCIGWQTLVFRRELYDAHGPIPLVPEALLARDWDYLIGISRRHHFAFLHEPTVAVRMHDASATSTEVRTAGRMAEDMLIIWRKWLVESDDPPVVTMAVWEAIANALLAGVQACYGPDRIRAAEYLSRLDTLKADYIRRQNRTFYGTLNGWLPGLADLDGDGLPIFHPGVAAMTLDSIKKMRFFHHPDWQSGRWEAVLVPFLEAFSASDDVELVFWLDPSQGVPEVAAEARIAAVLARVGQDLETAPTITLVPDPLDRPGLAALYAAVHAVVPAGDVQQLDRATKAGRPVMTHLEPEIWQNVAARCLGLPVAATT